MDAVTEAVRTGLPGELDSSRFQSVDGLPPLDERRARVRRLRRELGDTLAALKRAKRNVSLTEDDELAAEYMTQVEQHSRDKRRIEAELGAIEVDAGGTAVSESFESNGELVARAMAALANATDSADSALAAALCAPSSATSAGGSKVRRCTGSCASSCHTRTARSCWVPCRARCKT